MWNWAELICIRLIDFAAQFLIAHSRRCYCDSASASDWDTPRPKAEAQKPKTRLKTNKSTDRGQTRRARCETLIDISIKL